MKTSIKSNTYRCRTAIFVLACCILLSATTIADYSIKWYTIDGGGMQSKGGQFVVTGTIAQPDAGYHEGDSLHIEGGYWTFLPHCVVDMELFSKFAGQWLSTGPNLPADLHADTHVNLLDLQELAENWLCFCPFDWELR